MFDLFEWVMELLYLSVYSSLNYIAYSQLIEHFLSGIFRAIRNIYLVEGEGEEIETKL
jgi:hypothetical protein